MLRAPAVYLALISGACNSYNLYDKLANPGSGEDSVKKYTVFVSANSIQVASGATWAAAGGSTIGTCSTAGTTMQIADCACSFWGSSAGLGIRFRAWLSDSTSDAVCRIAGINGVGCNVSASGLGPYFNLQGGISSTQRQRTFRNLGDITSGTPPENAVEYQENGVAISGGYSRHHRNFNHGRTRFQRTLH